MYLYRLEANQLENKHAESALELLVGTKLPISQEYSSAERMSTIPSGCIRHSIVIRTREETLHLCSGLVRPCLKLWAHCWAYSTRETSLYWNKSREGSQSQLKN